MTRIAVDLDPKVHTALNSWISQAAADFGPPYLDLSEVITAMIVVCLRYTNVTDVLHSQIRHQRAAARERGERGQS